MSDGVNSRINYMRSDYLSYINLLSDVYQYGIYNIFFFMAPSTSIQKHEEGEEIIVSTSYLSICVLSNFVIKNVSIKEPKRINGDGLTEEYGKLTLEFNNLLKNIENNSTSGAMDALCFPINRSVAIAALESFHSSVIGINQSGLPIKQRKLNRIIHAARKQALQYCDQSLTGSKEMKQNIRKRVSIAIDSEVARVQYWNSVYLQYWRNKYNQVLLDFVRDYPLVLIGIGISLIPCFCSSWGCLFVVMAILVYAIKLYLEWVFWDAYIDGIKKNSS